MTIHINRPSSTRYQARVRYRGWRNYRLVGRPTKDKTKAIMAMAREFAGNSGYKRGDVVFYADYYDPEICVEITRP